MPNSPGAPSPGPKASASGGWDASGGERPVKAETLKSGPKSGAAGGSKAAAKGGKKKKGPKKSAEKLAQQQQDAAADEAAARTAAEEEAEQEMNDTSMMNSGNLINEDDLAALLASTAPSPTPEVLSDMRRGLGSDFSKLRQQAVAQIGSLAREHVHDPNVQQIVMDMLALLKSEPCNSPLARTLVTSTALLTVKPGGRNLTAPYTEQVLAVVSKGGRSIREKGCLALMNLTADEGCRKKLLDQGVIQLLLDLIRDECSSEEKDVNAKFLQHAVGSLCNISLNGGYKAQAAMCEAGAVELLLSLTSSNVDNLTTQRSAVLLETFMDQVPGAAAEAKKLAADVEAFRAMTPAGEQGRHRLHPAKVIGTACVPQS